MEAASENLRIKVLINLSSRLLCEGLQRLMEQHSTAYETSATCDPDNIREFTPHMILVDAATLEEPCANHWDGARVLLIDTGLSENEVVLLLCQHRLDGVISTGTGSDLFLKALEAVHAGQIWIDNGKIKSILHNHPPANYTSARESFSKREREIVLLIAEGRTNREIATQLIISEQTVKTHISRIFSKSNVTNRAQLAPLALKFKFESSPPLRD